MRDPLRVFPGGRVAFIVARPLLLALIGLSTQPAAALIQGGVGNAPLRDPGWPNGAAAIFNHPSRVSWWEGPPFGGGRWCAECRGDAKALNAVLADFAKMDAKNKRLVLHDGVGYSLWLNLNARPEERPAVRIDWQFTVWVPASWVHLQSLPTRFRPTDCADAQAGPPAQMDVYTGGNVRWSDVTVPPGIVVDDQRLGAHGFQRADGAVVEGNVTDFQSHQPLPATIRLENVEPQAKGGYLYKMLSETSADAQGHWVLKNLPPGRHRIVASADGYVSRVAEYLHVADQPGWRTSDYELSRPAIVSGRVCDADGKPLADVSVRLYDVATGMASTYDSPDGYETKSDADGRFRFEQVPIGKARIGLSKSGFCRSGLPKQIVTPSEEVALTMTAAAELHVTAVFDQADWPKEYLVEIEPIGRRAIGSWGGSARIDEKNQVSFHNIPPGRYTLEGHPNPTADRQRSEPITVDLEGGKTMDITLRAR